MNAVALGSIATQRYLAFLASQKLGAAVWAEEQMRALHPFGRVGRPEEVAAAVSYPLSAEASFINAEASFINGAILPVDGGRSALDPDPEAPDPATGGAARRQLATRHGRPAAKREGPPKAPQTCANQTAERLEVANAPWPAPGWSGARPRCPRPPLDGGAAAGMASHQGPGC